MRQTSPDPQLTAAPRMGGSQGSPQELGRGTGGGDGNKAKRHNSLCGKLSDLQKWSSHGKPGVDEERGEFYTPVSAEDSRAC